MIKTEVFDEVILERQVFVTFRTITRKRVKRKDLEESVVGGQKDNNFS